MAKNKFDISWLDRGRPPKGVSDPNHPGGIDLDMTHGAKRSCRVELPYPTGHDNIGGWLVRCLTCKLQVYVTAASRSDDPRSVRLPCKELRH